MKISTALSIAMKQSEPVVLAITQCCQLQWSGRSLRPCLTCSRSLIQAPTATAALSAQISTSNSVRRTAQQPTFIEMLLTHLCRWTWNVICKKQLLRNTLHFNGTVSIALNETEHQDFKPYTLSRLYCHVFLYSLTVDPKTQLWLVSRKKSSFRSIHWTDQSTQSSICLWLIPVV
jgi:hypothetical protein